VQSKVFGSQKEEITGAWRKIHNEELREICSSENISRVIKLRMRWAGHVVRGDILWSGNLKGRDRLEDVDVRIILKWILMTYDGRDW
jgi:riboflavin synthase alpha subunit